MRKYCANTLGLECKDHHYIHHRHHLHLPHPSTACLCLLCRLKGDSNDKGEGKNKDGEVAAENSREHQPMKDVIDPDINTM